MRVASNSSTTRASFCSASHVVTALRLMVRVVLFKNRLNVGFLSIRHDVAHPAHVRTLVKRIRLELFGVSQLVTFLRDLLGGVEA